MVTMLSGLFKKPSNMDEAFSILEDDMSEMIDLDLDAPPLEVATVEAPEVSPANVSLDNMADAAPEGGSDHHRLTAYTQSRLAALAAFDELQRATNEDMQTLSSAAARIVASHHSTRDFASTMHTSIHRANELELTNANLVAENRKLFQQAEQVKRLRSQHESLVDAHKRREAKIVDEVETLKSALTAAKLAASEAANTISAMETERADILNDLAAKASTAERSAREAEILRENRINLSLDLENAQRRHTEIERKFDELSAVHASESGQLSELRARLSANDKEIYRLQKQVDFSRARLTEMQDALSSAESEMDEASKAHASETQRLRTEIDGLKARVDVSAKAQLSQSNEIGTLRQKLADLASEKKLSDDRLVALTQEFEAERKAFASSVAGIAHDDEDDMEDAISLDAHNREIDELRHQIGALKTIVQRIAPYERMYQALREQGAQVPLAVAPNAPQTAPAQSAVASPMTSPSQSEPAAPVRQAAVLSPRMPLIGSIPQGMRAAE